MSEHLVLGPGICDPAVAALEVHLAKLPALQGRVDALFEPPLLFLVAHREPVLEQDDAVVDQHSLEGRTL